MSFASSEQELFGQYGAALFSQVCVSEAPKQVVQTLQQCHHVGAQPPSDSPGRVRVRGKRAWHIPGGIMKIVAATCSEQYSGSTVLFEPLENGLLASPALVRVIRGTASLWLMLAPLILHPRTAVGTLDFVNVVSLPSGVTEVPSSMATMSSQTASSSAQQQVEDIDLSTSKLLKNRVR